MSRRHHHHMQPFDYDRFNDHTRDNRDRDRETRGIEYQDDSLSSINSDEESYLHHPHPSKEKKSNFYAVKSEAAPKTNKREKTPNEPFKETVKTVTPDPTATSERLGRLESMLEQLIKRSNASPAPVQNVPEKETSERRQGQFYLDPRRHDFTTSMWINKIQEVSVQNNWDEKSTIQYMGTQMSGIIKAWYNSLPNYDFTWPEWKILISKIFPDNVDFVTTLKRLVTRLRQADESMTTYYFSKTYLIEACKITGEDAVSCLIDGLNNQDIQEQAKAQNYLTPESLYSQFLMVLPDYTVDYSPSVPPTTETVLNNWYYQNEEASAQENNVEVLPQEEVFEYEKDTIRNEDFDYRIQGNSGFHGNEGTEPRSIKSPPKRPGVHSRLDKRFIRPHFRPHNKIPMAAKVCSICFNRGHLARNCRKTDKALFCQLGKHEVNQCYFKKCYVNEHQVDAFIDSGCTTVAIKEKIARNLNLTVYPTSDVMYVYGGGSVKVKGETFVVIEVDSVSAPVRAVIVPDPVQNVSVVLGQAFLNQKNITVLMQNNTLKILEAPQN